MREPVVLKSDDLILNSLNFKPYRSMLKRRVVAFVPAEDQAQTMEIDTPWGAHLTVKKGDFLVSELETPDDVWPVNAQIFDASYIIVSPGICIKSAVTLLVPLTGEFDGCAEREVRVSSTALVHVDRNRYSVPAQWANTVVSVRLTADRVRMVADGQLIAEHSRHFA